MAPPHGQAFTALAVLTVVMEFVALQALNVEKQVVLQPCFENAELDPTTVVTPVQIALQSLAVTMDVHDAEEDD